MLIWTVCLTKNYLNSMRDLPLKDGKRAPRSNPENSDPKTKL
jgi:hypothetical protein